MSNQVFRSDANEFSRAGDRVVGLLVREINHATTWQQVNEASSAIFKVRLMQVNMEREHLRFGGGYASGWLPAPQEGRGKDTPRRDVSEVPSER